MSLPAPRVRRVLVIGLVFAIAAISCGRELTAPNGALRFARGISWNAIFPEVLSQVGVSGTGVVPFTRVHVVLRRADNSIALDTVIDFPASASSVPVTLTVPLAAGAPATGEVLSLNLAYINAAGDTVFRGGPTPVLAAPTVPGAPAPPPVSIPVSYTGPGATATILRISPRQLAVGAGSTFNFTAIASGPSGAIPGTPIVWTSLDQSLATISSPGAGAGSALTVRGSVRIVAQLLTGPADTATLVIQPTPANITLVSGNTQTGPTGSVLAQQVTVLVKATDGLPVQGVSVAFAASNSGVVGAATVATDVNGIAQTTWRLGTLLGAQSLTATAAGLTGSPVTFTATATASTPTKLAITTQPSATTTVGTALAPVVVTVQDVNSNTAATFTGPVTVAFGTNTVGALLSGTTTVNAVAGIATFSTLSINKTGAGFTLVATSPLLTSATSNAFATTAGAAVRLSFTTAINNSVGGATLTPTITVAAVDSLGNTVTTFTDTVRVAIGNNPGAATQSGAVKAVAVAGVASFSTLAIDKAGSGYTLAASATGLITAASLPFDVVVGPAANLVLASGAGQTGPISTALPAPVIVMVTDIGGNGVAGQTVTFATANGTVTPASGVTNALGQVSTSWTLGATLGAQTMTATSAGLAGSPLTITATAASGVGGPATSLAFSTGPTTVVAGVANAPAIVVQARDAVSALATTFTGNVTLAIGTNPGAATIGGTVTVAAVGGVATFPNVTLDKVGVGYTLTATSGALPVATSGLFNVLVGPATNLVVASGGAQSGPISTALASPVIVKVTDIGGNGVAGKTVTFATANGTVTPVSGVTDALGQVSVSWTIGATLGAQTLTATSAGLTGSPLTINATATAGGAGGPAATLLFTTGPTTALAGASNAPAIIVQARDAVAGLATTFTGNVTLAIGTNPGTSTIGGTVTVAAVGGIATFPNITLNKTGNGYTLTATSGALPVATSGTFNITPALAANLTITAGNSQSANALSVLPAPLTVTVTDAFTNTVPGVAVGFAITTGGGSLGTTAAVTNAAGQATSVWTLGGLAGAQTVTATSAGLAGSPAVFTATGIVVGLRTWTGATNTLWNTTTNWSPVGVPLSTDSVVVPFITNLPNISTVTTIKALTLAPSAVLTLNSTLTVNGNLDATGTISGSGGVVLGSVTPASVKGVVSQPIQITNALYLVTGALSANSLQVMGTGAIDINGQSVVIGAGGISTAGSATIKMTQPGSALSTTGGASFAGGSETGLLTTGTLTVSSNFNEGGGSTSAFVATSGHTTILNGSVATNFSFTDPNTSSFGNLTINDAAGITALTTFQANNVTMTAGILTGTLGGTINGTLTDPLGKLQLPSISFGSSTAPVSATTPTITVTTGSVTFNNNPSTLAGNLTVNGPVNVLGNLQLNGHTLNVTGNFATAGSGTLTMTNGADIMNIAGTALFAGGSETGLLTAGTLSVKANFSQAGGSTSAFTATVGHTTVLNGTVPTSFTFANPNTSSFGSLTINDTAGVTALSTFQASNITMTAGILSGTLGGTINGTLTDPLGKLQLSSISFASSTSPVSATTPAIIGSVTFNNNPSILAANLTVNGTVNVLGNLQLNGHTLTVTGNFATVANGQLTMNNAADVMNVTGSATFGSTTAGGPMSLGTMNVGGDFTQSGSVQSLSTFGSNTIVLNGAALQNVNFLTPDINYTSSCSTSCFQNLTVNQAATGSLSFATPVKVMGAYSKFGARPVSATNGSFIVVGNAALGQNATYHRIGLASSSYSKLGGTAVDSVSYFGGGQTYNPAALGEGYSDIRGTVNWSAPGTLTGEMVLSGTGQLNLSTSGAVVTGNFTSNGSATLKMTTNVTDSLQVNGNAVFNGGATTGLLTTGAIAVSGNLTTNGPAFDASGTHRVWMTKTTGTQQLLGNPGSTNNGFQDLIFSNAGIKQVQRTVFAFNVKGKLIVQSGSGTVIGGGALGEIWMKGGGSVYDLTATSDQLQLDRLLLDGNGSGPSVILPKTLKVSDLIIMTGTTTLVDSLHLIGGIKVDGSSAELELNSNLVRITGAGSYFFVQNGGFLKMINAGDSLMVENGAPILFDGGSSVALLKAGKIFASGNFTQAATTSNASFAQNASSTLKTVFNSGGTQIVTFASPATSFFQDLELRGSTSTTVALASNIVLKGTLSHDANSIGHGFSSTTASTMLVTASGLIGAAYPTNFNNVALMFLDGTANGAIQTYNFLNFPVSYTGTAFTVNRTTAPNPLTLTTINFISFTLAGGKYITNLGSVPLNPSGTCTVSIAPTIGTCP